MKTSMVVTYCIILGLVMVLFATSSKAQGYNVAQVTTDGVVTITPAAIVGPLTSIACLIISAIAALYILYVGVRILFDMMAPDAPTPDDPMDEEARKPRTYYNIEEN